MQLRISNDGNDERDLFDRGEYTVCLHLLGENPQSNAGFLLRLRCLLRLGRAHDVVRMDTLARAKELIGFERLEACGLVGTACYRADMRLPADNYFREGYALAESLNASREQTAELRYFDALRKWSAHDFDGTERIAKDLLLLPEWELKGRELLAWVAAGRGDLDEQLQHLAKAIDCKGDVWNTATSLHAYAELAYELYRPVHAHDLAARANAFAWTSDMNVQRFWTYRGLGWMNILAGNTFKAYEYYCKAEDAATVQPALKALVFHDKAFASLMYGQRETALEYTAHAVDIIKRCNFKTNDTERVTLLYLTALCVRMDNALAAQECWETYTAIATRITPMKAFGLGDKRLAALEAYASGWMLRAKGDSAGAKREFLSAFQIWREIGYTWRAVDCAVIVLELSRRMDLAEYALIQSDRFFPKAWFSESLKAYRKLFEHPILKPLSDTKRGVLLGLMRGLKYREIAAELQISYNTVRNHVQDFFDEFCPEKRRNSALVRVMRERGIE